MHLSMTTLAPVTLFLIVSCTSVDSQTASLKSSPICMDLAKVEGPVIEFGEESLNNSLYSRSSTTIDSKGQLVTDQLQQNSVGVDSKGHRYVSPPSINSKLRPEVIQISPSTVKALVDLANVKGFWTMTENDKADRPSSSTAYILIRLSCTNHRVSVSRSNEPSQFTELYKLLRDLERVQPKKVLR